MSKRKMSEEEWYRIEKYVGNDKNGLTYDFRMNEYTEDVCLWKNEKSRKEADFQRMCGK